MALVYPQSRDEQTSFKESEVSISSSRKFVIKSNDKKILSAPQFKYQLNASAQDIEAIRSLIAHERSRQREDDYDFCRADYERMMRDDWLVSRFLLRGKKLSLEKEVDLNQLSHVDYTIVHLKTLELIKSCAKFKKHYAISSSTKLSEFPIEWIKVGGLFNYKPDLAGNPVMYLRVKLHKPKLIESKELRYQFKRLLLYTLEKCDQDLINDPGKGICCVFDMSGATFENVDLELLSWMIKSFKNFSPKLLCYVIVYNLPWFFSATFKLISNTLMSNSNRQCLKFVYGVEILNFIGRNNLPMYITESI